MPSDLPPFWQCPKCGERFITENMWHSCGKFSLDELFARSEPHVIQLLHKIRGDDSELRAGHNDSSEEPRRVSSASPIQRMLSSQVTLLCGLALPRVDDDPRFFKVEKYATHFIGHSFRVYSEADLDEDVQRWMRESYEVGAQKQLKR